MGQRDEASGDRGPRPAETAESGVRTGKFPWKTILILSLAAAAIAGGIFWRRHHAAQGPGKPGANARGGSFPVAAVIGIVAETNIPIYLDGLGTVQAFNTVAIRSRVEGQLQKVAFKEGQDVRAGDLLAQIDPEPFRAQVEQAQGKKGQDEAQLANARVQLKRNAELLSQHIVSQEMYDTQKAQVDQLEAAVKADQAAVNAAQVQLNYTTITAPIDGRTGIRQVDEGNIVRANDTNGIVVLAQLKPIAVVFTLPEQSLAEIQQQFAGGEMKVLSVDRDNSTVLGEGKLSVIDNQIDTATGTIRLKAAFPNQDLRLWPGQFVNTRLLLKVRTNAIVVPASVVQRGPEGPYAFTVNNDMSVEMRRLKVALVEQDLAVIESGLRAGEKVVVDGQYKLQPGAKVKPAGAAAGERAGSTQAPAGPRRAGEGGGRWPGASQQPGQRGNSSGASQP